MASAQSGPQIPLLSSSCPRRTSSQAHPTARACCLCPTAGSASPGAVQDGCEDIPRSTWPPWPSSCAQRLVLGAMDKGLAAEAPSTGPAVRRKSLTDPTQPQAHALPPGWSWAPSSAGQDRGKDSPSAGSSGAGKWRRLRRLHSGGTLGWGRVRLPVARSACELGLCEGWALCAVSVPWGDL